MITRLLRNYFVSSLLLLMATTPIVYAQYSAKKTPQTINAVSDKEKNVSTESFIRTELFFGQNKADGAEITEEEFADFLNVTITVEFPDGLTVLSGCGQFRDETGKIIQEKTKILILLYPFNTRIISSLKIERIRTAYKERFTQQSILRVDSAIPVKTSF